MVIALDPEQTFEIELDIDAARPAAERRKLVCRHPTARQFLKMRDLTHQGLDAATDLALEADLHTAAIGVIAQRWTGGGKPDAKWDPVAVLDYCSFEELRELAVKAAHQGRLREHEKKASALQSQSAAATKSAATAEPPASASGR